MNDTTQNLEHKNICNKKSLDAEITTDIQREIFRNIRLCFITAYDIKRIKFLKQADRRLKARYNINVILFI